jgi:hypothetical protein
MQIPPKLLVTIVLASILLGGYIERRVSRNSTNIVSNKDDSTTQNKIVTTIKETKNKDGSSETDTTIVDNSRIVHDDDSTITTAVKHDWILQGGVGLNTGLEQLYMVGVQRRILGDIYLGAWGTTTKEAGLSISIQF